MASVAHSITKQNRIEVQTAVCKIFRNRGKKRWSVGQGCLVKIDQPYDCCVVMANTVIPDGQVDAYEVEFTKQNSKLKHFFLKDITKEVKYVSGLAIISIDLNSSKLKHGCRNKTCSIFNKSPVTIAALDNKEEQFCCIGRKRVHFISSNNTIKFPGAPSTVPNGLVILQTSNSTVNNVNAVGIQSQLDDKQMTSIWLHELLGAGQTPAASSSNIPVDTETVSNGVLAADHGSSQSYQVSSAAPTTTAPNPSSRSEPSNPENTVGTASNQTPANGDQQSLTAVAAAAAAVPPGSEPQNPVLNGRTAADDKTDVSHTSSPSNEASADSAAPAVVGADHNSQSTNGACKAKTDLDKAAPSRGRFTIEGNEEELLQDEDIQDFKSHRRPSPTEHPYLSIQRPASAKEKLIVNLPPLNCKEEATMIEVQQDNLVPQPGVTDGKTYGGTILHVNNNVPQGKQRFEFPEGYDGERRRHSFPNNSPKKEEQNEIKRCFSAMTMEKKRKINLVGEQLLSKAVRDNALLLEKISKYLDRENRVIKCWKHLAYVLDVPAEEIRTFDHFTEHSPTEDMFRYLVNSWRPELTIKELKEKLNNVYRNDIIEGLIKGGFRDDMLVADLMSGQPTFIAFLSSKLDGETRTIGNWQSLATQFGIRKQITEQFGLRGCGPTGALFLHMQTVEGLRDMTMGQLRKHFKGMERNDLVKILAKYGFSEETDSHLVINEVVDGSELLAEIGERLNKEIRAVKNWRNLAYRLKIPLEVYNTFDTSKAAAKSPTKMMFDWLAQWKPGLHVDDLLKGLKQIDRFDVVDLVTNEVSAEIARKKQADSIDSGTTLQFAAKQAFSDLQQMRRDADKQHSQLNLLPDADKQHSQLNLLPGLAKKALERGLMVSDNRGEGNCMFYALAEQLKVRKETMISHGDLRKVLVHYLKGHPKLPDGTDLYSFVYGYPSWKDYLEGMDKDGTWGDHVILFTAANCCKCVIRVISSVLNSEDVIILPNPPVQNAVELVLGHIFEAHYVSLIPMSAVSDGVSRGCRQGEPADGYNSQNLQNSGYRQPPPPYATSTQLMRSQGQHQLPAYHQLQDQQLPQRHQQPADQKQRYSTCDKNMVEVRKLPYPVYNKICIKLNIKRDFFDDFRMVAEQLGMDRDSTELAEQNKNPTHHIFSQRCPNVKVRDLVEALHKIERMDVAEELERWIAEA